jgi:two-component system phosphate regulon sensor histidine kinase PhoR
VLQVDARGRVAYANPAAAQHMGYHPEDMLRLALPRLFQPAVIGDPSTTAPVVAAFRANERYFGEETLVRADGSTVPVDIGIYPVDVDEGPVGAVIIFQNTADRMLREQRHEEFLALAAHELRTPLTSILGFSRRLDRRRAQLDDETADAVATLLTQSERMRSTVDAFLDMSRLEADVFRVEIEPVALRQVVATEVAELEERSPEVEVELDAAEITPIIESDEMRLRQVLVNLLNNAVRHGGSPPRVVVRIYPRGGGFAVSVSDNGRGIAPEDRPHVFERFFRRPGSEPRGEGLGVGLYLSRQIADRLGASLTFETEVGEGTTFVLLLPERYTPGRRQWTSETRDRSLRPSM